MVSKKPKLICFDLDYTLWPFWVDTHVTPPFKKCSSGSIVDALGNNVRSYPESTEILKSLHQQDYILAVASRTSEISGAKQLIELFGWKDLLTYTQIFPGCKTQHFENIKSSSGIAYSDMMFFDDEHRNIKDLTAVGVFSVLVNRGMTKKVLDDALKQYESNHR